MASYKNNITQSLVAVLLLIGAAIYAFVGIAQAPQGTTITNEAISSYLFKTGQRVVQRSNKTETFVQNTSLAVSLELTLSVSALVGNGIDSCEVQARVRDASGNPIPDGQPVEFTTTRGTYGNGNDTTYTLTFGGIARTWLHSELLTSSQPINAVIGASTLGASGQALTGMSPMLFYSAALKGQIVSLSRRRVEGIIPVLYDPVQQEIGRDTVESDGTFIVPIVQTGVYTLAFRYTNAFGDDIVVYAKKHVEVPSAGGVPAVSPFNTIVGSIVDIANGQAIRQADLPVMLYRSATSQPTNEGRVLPALQATDDRGVFAFDSLAAGTSELFVMDARYSGKQIVQHLAAGTFVIDANISLADAPTFEVVKTANRRIAEIGDVITYTVQVRNTSTSAPLANIRLVDELPHSFVYAKHSARKDSAALEEPAHTRTLEWSLADSLQPGKSIRVSYSVNVGSGALESDGINKAHAFATNAAGQEIRSPQASLQVTVRPGVFNDRGIVVGKIFYDENENAQQEDGESGISGVELWMEDGTRIVTGEDGKYSLPEVRAGQHVMRVNELTLPYGAELLALKSESAGDGLTRFVRLVEGGIVRTDFYVKAPRQASAEVVFGKTMAESFGERIPAMYVIRYNQIGMPTKIALVDTLPNGYSFDYKAITWRKMKLYPDGVQARVLAMEFQKRSPNTADTIRVMILADSAAGGNRLQSNGNLTLSYVHGKPAVFPIGERFGSIPPEETEQPVIAATPDTTKRTIAQTEVKPETTSRSAAAETTKSVAQTRPKRVRTTRIQPTTKVDSLPTSSSDSSTIAQTTPMQQTQPQPDIAARNNGEQHYFDEFNFGDKKVVGLVGAGALLIGLLLFFLWWRRRKKEEEGK